MWLSLCRREQIPVPVIPFYKKGCQDKYLLTTVRPRENGLIVQPRNGTRLCEFSFPVDSSCRRNDDGPFLTQQAEWLCGANHGSIGDFSPIAFSGCPRGHRVSRQTQCRSTGLTGFWILTLEPERLKNQPAIARNESRDGLSPDAQAACCFRCSASKLTPFFQTIKVMAAILRARVSRAIVGFIPRASRPAWNS